MTVVAAGPAAQAEQAQRVGIRLTINGVPVPAQVEPRTSLADFLRDERHLTGTHVSCEQGVCGACTLLVDGRPVRGCLTWAAGCDGADVRTIEGFDDDATMSALREAFSREHALQCGFCTPGMLITARDIVTRLPGIDETRLRHELSGNLCRCTGYAGIVRAVASVAAAGAQAAARSASASGTGAFVAFEALPASSVPVTSQVAASTGAAPIVEPPAASVALAAAAAEPAAGAAPARAGLHSTRVSESLVVRGCTPASLWNLLGDVPAAAACLPGASVERFDGRELAGSVRVAFGPVTARFAGVGTIERDEASRCTFIRGGGRDGLSKTEAQATIEYRVRAADDPADAVLEVAMDYAVQGPLAQFSRSDLVRSLVTQLVREFGSNLERLSAGETPAQAKPRSIGALRLIWRWFRDRLAAVIGARGH